jgi:hypothetical protein
MAKKDFSVKVMADQIVYSNISKSGDGYSSARVVMKKGEGEYMSISYEWKDGPIPGFAMDLMAFMKANELAVAGIVEGREDDYKNFLREEDEEEKESE